MYERYIDRKPLPSEIDEREDKLSRMKKLPLKKIHQFVPDQAPFLQILKTPIDIVDAVFVDFKG